MHSQTLARGIAAGAVLAASAFVLIARLPNDTPPVRPTDEPFAAPRIETAADAGEEPVAPPPVDPQAAAEKFRELQAMSETFRHSTFLIAIRDAGYVCNELLRVSGGLDDSPKWMATCSETMSYFIAIASDGTLDVVPFLQYFDGIGVRPVEQDLLNLEERVPPPQTLPQR